MSEFDKYWLSTSPGGVSQVVEERSSDAMSSNESISNVASNPDSSGDPMTSGSDTWNGQNSALVDVVCNASLSTAATRSSKCFADEWLSYLITGGSNWKSASNCQRTYIDKVQATRGIVTNAIWHIHGLGHSSTDNTRSSECKLLLSMPFLSDWVWFFFCMPAGAATFLGFLLTFFFRPHSSSLLVSCFLLQDNQLEDIQWLNQHT